MVKKNKSSVKRERVGAKQYAMMVKESKISNVNERAQNKVISGDGEGR